MLLFKERMMTQLHFIQMVQTRLNNRSAQIGSAQTSVQFATVHLSLCLHTNHRKTFKYVWDIISFGWFECKQRHYVEDYFLHIATSLKTVCDLTRYLYLFLYFIPEENTETFSVGCNLLSDYFNAKSYYNYRVCHYKFE